MQNFRLAQDARLAQEYRDQLDAQQERLLAVDKLEAELSRARKYCQELDLCRIKYEVLLLEFNMLLLSSNTRALVHYDCSALYSYD